MTHWSADYVGLLYSDRGRSRDGVDCWGLVWLVYGDLGIEIPSYAGEYASAQERAEISGLIAGAKPDWIKVEAAQAFDLVTVRRGTLESHIGIVVAPGRMLHATKAHASRIEDYTSTPFRNRVTGIWRHRRLAEGALP